MKHDHIADLEKDEYMGTYWFKTKSAHVNFSFKDRYIEYDNECLGCVVLGLVMDCKWLINRKNGEFD